MARQIDYLIASGPAVPGGPQYLASSTILALAKGIGARGSRAAILVIDPTLDPGAVARGDSEGVAVFRTSQPVSTLPALSLALGGPRILVLPNQLAAYDLLRLPGLDALAWLGEDDLAPLGRQLPVAPMQYWGDSGYVADLAGALLQQPVAPVAPPSGPASVAAIASRPDTIAVMGARPRDGIALTLALAAARRDLRFIVIDWPRLGETERQDFFARAARCGNIDWRRPDGPAALLEGLLEAAVILVPAQQPIGHRDWVDHCRRCGRHLLGSDLGALPALIGADGETLPPTAPPARWLERLDHLRMQVAAAEHRPGGGLATPVDLILDRLMAPSPV
ncbi:MAG TPA: hypothetical protein VM639_04680 [Dongiaceae bacterium]|nr:hypothetical protein [Dongiaceae bacterium]